VIPLAGLLACGGCGYHSIVASVAAGPVIRVLPGLHQLRGGAPSGAIAGAPDDEGSRGLARDLADGAAPPRAAQLLNEFETAVTSRAGPAGTVARRRPHPTWNETGTKPAGGRPRRSESTWKVAALESGGGGNRTARPGTTEEKKVAASGPWGMSKLPASPVVSSDLVPEGRGRAPLTAAVREASLYRGQAALAPRGSRAEATSPSPQRGLVDHGR
jgi:hypothetical protein